MRVSVSKTLYNILLMICGFAVYRVIRQHGSNTRPVPLCQQTKNYPRDTGTLVETSTETDNSVMIGVMTTRKFLLTRGAAIYATWGRDIAGSVIFYIGQRGNGSFDNQQTGRKEPVRTEPVQMMHNLPVVELVNVSDTVYPPRQKSFAMLSHMYHNFGHHYRWFVRADDDVYIRYELLVKILNSLDSERRWYIGHPGYGTPEMKGRLGLLSNKPYCMGGPGIVFSFLSLRLLVPHLQNCDQTPVTSHEDSELGRCMQRYVKVSCTKKAKIYSKFHQNYMGVGSDIPFSSSMFSAITMHAFKDPKLMFKLHNQFQILQLRQLRDRQQKLNSEIEQIRKVIGFPEEELRVKNIKDGTAALIAALNNKNRNVESDTKSDTKSQTLKNVDDNPVWGYAIFHKAHSVGQTIPARKLAMRNAANTFLRFTKKLRALGKKRIVAKYQSYTVSRGLQHIISISKGNTFQSFLMSAPLQDLHWRELQHYPISSTTPDNKIQRLSNAQKITESGRGLFPETSSDFSPELLHEQWLTSQRMTSWPELWLLVAVCGRHQSYLRFLNYLTRASKKYPARVHLLVALYPDPLGEHNLTMDTSKAYASLNITIHSMSMPFSRSISFQTLASMFEGNTILVFVDVDIVMTERFLSRVALNVKPGTAYFPILFSTFAPQAVCYGLPKCRRRSFDFSHRSGLWRSFGFGMMALTAEDYHKVGGLNTSIEGWGGEDVNFYERCVSHGIQIFRAADVGMFHEFHDKFCDPKLSLIQLAMCRRSTWTMYGSQATLAQMALDMEVTLG